MNKGLSRSFFEKIAGPGAVEAWDASHARVTVGPATATMNEEIEFQTAVLRDIAERCEDIAYDVEQIPGWEVDGRLGGIHAVALQQPPRIQNLIERLRAKMS